MIRLPLVKQNHILSQQSRLVISLTQAAVIYPSVYYLQGDILPLTHLFYTNQQK